MYVIIFLKSASFFYAGKSFMNSATTFHHTFASKRKNQLKRLFLCEFFFFLFFFLFFTCYFTPQHFSLHSTCVINSALMVVMIMTVTMMAYYDVDKSGITALEHRQVCAHVFNFL